MRVKVAATQMTISKDIEKNIKKAKQMVRDCASSGANVVLLQELFKTTYFCQIENYDYFDLAEEEKSSLLLQEFSELAKELGVVIPVSFFERSGNVYFNSIVVFDNDGSNLGIYRKTHIPDGQCYEEKFYFSPGDTGFKVFNTAYGKIGIGICWDQWFSETARILTLMGAEMLLFPTAIGSEPILKTDTSSHWQNVMKGHAAANIIPVIASNRIGTETEENSSMTFYGRSFIAGPDGNTLKELDRSTDSYAICEFDLDEINKTRRTWGIFRDRRPNMYKGILEKDLS